MSRLFSSSHHSSVPDPGREEIQARLEELTRILLTMKAEIPEEIHEAVRAVAAEVSKDKPNKITLKGILSNLVDATRTLGTVGTAVEALKAVVFPWL